MSKTAIQHLLTVHTKQPSGQLSNGQVDVEDLVLQVALEAAHHRHHDDEGHHAHPHPADRQRGHHPGGRALLLIAPVQRLGGEQRILLAELADPRALDGRVRPLAAAKGDIPRDEARLHVLYDAGAGQVGSGAEAVWADQREGGGR